MSFLYNSFFVVFLVKVFKTGFICTLEVFNWKQEEVLKNVLFEYKNFVESFFKNFFV